MSNETEQRPSRALQITLSLAMAALIVLLVGAAVTDRLPLDRLPEEQQEKLDEAEEEEAERLEEQREEEAERREERREDSEDAGNGGSG